MRIVAVLARRVDWHRMMREATGGIMPLMAVAGVPAAILVAGVLSVGQTAIGHQREQLCADSAAIAAAVAIGEEVDPRPAASAYAMANGCPNAVAVSQGTDRVTITLGSAKATARFNGKVALVE